MDRTLRNFSERGDNVGRIWLRPQFAAIALASLLAISGCLPKEVALPSDSGSEDSSGAYAGFNGATKVVTTGATKVKVFWNASSDANVVAYNIYDASFIFNPRLVKTVPAPATEASLTGLSNQTLYRFRVRAANAEGVEDANTKDLAAIPYAGITSTSVVSSTSARINFADGTEANQIQVLCKIGSSTTEEVVASTSNVALTSLLLNDLLPSVIYKCRAALLIDGVVDNNENWSTFTPLGQADHLVFTTQPGNGNAGQNLSAQPVVKIMDANGNLVAGGPDATAVITLNIAVASPTPGSIQGVASVAAVGGVATFSNLNIREAGIKIMSASKSDTSSLTFGTGALSVSSDAFTISPGPVSPLNSTIALDPPIPPGAILTANGSDSYNIVIYLKDEFGNSIVGVKPAIATTVLGDTLVQPTLATDATGKTTASISTTIADSVAPFRQLNITSPSGLSSVQTAAPFVPGPAVKIAYALQPVNSPAGAGNLSRLELAVQDAQGNRVYSGTGSDASIAISIQNNVNGAVLSGTTPVQAVQGLAVFSDLGISKTGTGYRLTASSGSYTPATSNTFNITAGVPQKIKLTGLASLVSGACSSGYTVRLEDNGNNPANAILNTTLTISGLTGGAAFYSSATCGGSPLGSTLTFTAGTNTRTIYLKSNRLQALNVSISDSSAVMSPASLAINVLPNKMSLAATMPPPAQSTDPFTVPAGQCSSELIITPSGEDGVAGPILQATPISITGVSGSMAKIYSDSTCATELDPANLILPVSTPPVYTTKFYIKDSRAEVISVSLADLGGVIQTMSPSRMVTVGPSTLAFAGPSTVVSGQCSAVFTITLKDLLNNSVIAGADTALTVNGIPGGSAAKFYSSSNCSGAGSSTSLTLPAGNTTLPVYLKGVAAETLNIFISDPAGKMANSATRTVSITPSAFRITGPSPQSAKNSVCAGPFLLNTLDGLGSITPAVNSITANLTGQGVAGKFFTDSTCAVPVTSYTFATGENEKSFYFKGQFPEVLTFSATDQALVLSTATYAWEVLASEGWLGTASKMFDSIGNLLWFRTGYKPTAARYDGVRSVRRLAFNPDYQYLYVLDNIDNKIVKYDYLNKTYIGWTGNFYNRGGVPVSGSNLGTPSPALCVTTTNNTTLPGWCVGGQATYNGNATGGLSDPFDIAVDDSYVYVTNYNGSQSVNRYDANTGAFAGRIGWITSSSGMTAGPGAPATCTTTSSGNMTPGWCIGGGAGHHGTAWGWQTATTADGRSTNMRGIEVSGSYLYVGSQGVIWRYNKASGVLAGWIGAVGQTPTGGAAGCSTAAVDSITPGWCTGGKFKEVDPTNHFGNAGGVRYPSDLFAYNNKLYYVDEAYRYVAEYNLSTGAFIRKLPYPGNGWKNPRQMVTDGSKVYFADWERVVKTDFDGLTEGWLGKIESSAGLSGSGCSTLVPNANTPNWCLGGTVKPGIDETSFYNLGAITYDGSGKILIGQEGDYPTIKKFDAVSGVYEGQLALEADSPKEWSDNRTSKMERHGFADGTLWEPWGSYVDGNYLYVTERLASRVKKIDKLTGQVVGHIGAVTSVPTGGQQSSLCLASNAMTASPAWCLGSYFLPNALFTDDSIINRNTDGLIRGPSGITSDSTWLYVTDRDNHRIVKFNKATGAYGGWIGVIASGWSPTGGDAGCAGAPANTFTPGWCKGGLSREWDTSYGGTAFNGGLYLPGGILHLNGKLYVVDTVNGRISSYVAATGAFAGWIGGVSANPSSGCTFANNGVQVVSTSGWCFGGASIRQNNASTADRGGGLRFWGQWGVENITTDGTNLYVPNFHNIRIDKFGTDGTFKGSVQAYPHVYTNGWTTAPATIGNMGSWQSSYPMSVWTDGTNLYGTSHWSHGYESTTVWKMNLSTGNMIGWRGAIEPANLPTGGETGCAGATVATPGWCVGGRPTMGVTLGQMADTWSFVSGDEKFVYVTDPIGNRVTRFPK